MTDLSIVIPTLQRNNRLRTLLLALGEQSLAFDRFEVIVAIDGQAAGTEALLQSLDVPYALQWLPGPHNGPGMARNRGAAAAGGRILLFLDDDMMPGPGLLEAHRQAHQGLNNVICLGRVRLLPEHRLTTWEQYLNGHFESHYEKMGRAGYRPTFWDCLSGNLSLSRRLFEESGGFDPVFGRGKHEDIELGYRLSGLGVRFRYDPEALSYHCFGKNQAEGLFDGRLSGISTLHFVRRYPDLFPQLVQARWQRYPAVLRRLLRAALPSSSRRRQLATRSAVALDWVERSHLPARLRLPVYRLAYHLQFWHGLAQTAEPDELQTLLGKLGA